MSCVNTTSLLPLLVLMCLLIIGGGGVAGRTIKPGICPTINVNQLKQNGDDLNKLSLHFNQNNGGEYNDYEGGADKKKKGYNKHQQPHQASEGGSDYSYEDDSERNQDWYLCERSCSSDDSCLSGQKCCPTSCNGTICVGFAVEKMIKSGKCPLNLDRIFLCAKIEDECDNDAQCPNDLKCCESVCGNICQEPSGGIFPLSTKPGKCPFNAKKSSGSSCLNQCRNDFSCPKSMKCCMRGCDKVCINPNQVGRGASNPSGQGKGKGKGKGAAGKGKKQRGQPSRSSMMMGSRFGSRLPSSGGARSSAPSLMMKNSLLQRSMGSRMGMNRLFG